MAGPSVPTRPTTEPGSSPAASVSRSHAGRATEVRLDRYGITYATAAVRFADNGDPVSQDVVLVEVSDGGRSFTVPTDVGPSGRFGTDYSYPFGDDTKWLQAHFLGSFSAADAESEQVEPAH